MAYYTSFTELREKTGLSIQDVATITGVSVRTVYRWENNKTRPKRSVTEMLALRAKQPQIEQFNSKPWFKFIDLFAGIGGFRKGFESINGECVFTSEWDKYARQTYQENFDCSHPVTGDIREVKEQDIPSHDIVLAGFPCQPFSIAGVSKNNALGRSHGFQYATKGTLFFDVARIIDYHRPAGFLLENVRNLKHHDKGNTFKIIMETLREDLGYHVEARIINGKGYVPQHRERVYIVGFKEKTDFSFEDLLVPNPQNGPILNTILHPEDGSEEMEPPYTVEETGRVNEKYTLTPRLWEYLQEYAAKHKAKGNGFGFGLNDRMDKARTLSARYYKDGSEILIKQKNQRPRRLTPRECARLMGFDSPGHPVFSIPVSDTQAYKQFGNSVVVPVIKAIAKHMEPHFKSIISSEVSTNSRLQKVAV